MPTHRCSCRSCSSFCPSALSCLLLLSLSLAQLRGAVLLSEWGLSPLSSFFFLLHILKVISML